MGILRYNRRSTMENAKQAWTASRTSEPQMCHSVKSGAITKPCTGHAMPQQQRRYSLRKTVKTSREARDASPELPTWVRRGTRDRAIKIKLVGRWAQVQPSSPDRPPTVSSDDTHNQRQHQYSLRKTVKTTLIARDASPELRAWVRRGTRDKAVKIKLVGRWAQPQTPSPTHQKPTSSPDHDQGSIVDSPAPL
ncbi:hypothetical protein AB5N19_07894 [Seiridium cardinale]